MIKWFACAGGRESRVVYACATVARERFFASTHAQNVRKSFYACALHRTAPSIFKLLCLFDFRTL